MEAMLVDRPQTVLAHWAPTGTQVTLVLPACLSRARLRLRFYRLTRCWMVCFVVWCVSAFSSTVLDPFSKMDGQILREFSREWATSGRDLERGSHGNLNEVYDK